MKKIRNIHARQILDSRGNPTLEVDIFLDDGSFGRAAVPSGASTGEHEAVELRDNTKAYLGKSVGQAIENVNHVISDHLVGMNALDIKSVDEKMIKLENMSKSIFKNSCSTSLSSGNQVDGLPLDLHTGSLVS